MRIDSISCKTYPKFGWSFNSDPSFRGWKKRISAKEIISKTPLKREQILGIRSGTYGTMCEGSRALEKFTKHFRGDELCRLIQKGLSTNTDGYAQSFLKSSAEKPLSTSFVHTCSVMYLYNKIKNTHFLYHVFHNVNNSELEYVIKKFMPEGFTKAAIVPGDAEFVETHKSYLNTIYDSIKQNDKSAQVDIFHKSSSCPEIVGYRGKMYEIPNQQIQEQLQEGISGSDLVDSGQATFEICDLRLDNTIGKIASISDCEQLKQLKKIFKTKKINNEVLNILNSTIDERILNLKKIESCNSIEELKSLLRRIESKNGGADKDIFTNYQHIVRKRGAKITGNPLKSFLDSLLDLITKKE